jgi:hypothetical protein
MPRSNSPLAAGASGRSTTIVGRLPTRPGICNTLPASSLPLSSTTATVCRCVTSGGTIWRNIGSIAYSVTSTPAKPDCSNTGTCNWKAGEPLALRYAAEYTGPRRLRALLKVRSASLATPDAGSSGTMAPPLGLTSGWKTAAACVARSSRCGPTHDTCVTAGRSRTSSVAAVVKDLASSAPPPTSRARRINCSWSSDRNRRICCCAISVSRCTASPSRSISSLRSVQKAAMIAARNSSTEINGPRVAKRSWRVGDWRRHQRPNSRWVRGTTAVALGLGSEGDGMWPDYRGPIPRRWFPCFHIMKHELAIWNFLGLMRHSGR